jgi:hypothetical protein
MANAIKLKNAAQRTATLGDSTRVDTTVEIELAASCIPLVKSNASAVKMMKIIKISSGVILQNRAKVCARVHLGNLQGESLRKLDITGS